jgi:plastocyanin
MFPTRTRHAPAGRRRKMLRPEVLVPIVLLVVACNGDPLSVSNTGTSAAPVITSQPASVTVAAGATVTFTVTATGTPPLTYQWSRDNVEITGATQASYVLQGVNAGDGGATFSVKVSNTFGTVNSESATLIVQ